MGAFPFPASRVTPHFGLKDSRFQSLTFPMVSPTSIVTAGNVNLTAAQLLGGLITRNPQSVARTDTLPTAASLVAAIQGCMVGTSFQCEIRNTGGGAFTVTLAVPPGGGVTLDVPSTVIIPQNQSGTYMFVFTGITTGQEACTVYSLGVCTF